MTESRSSRPRVNSPWVNSPRSSRPLYKIPSLCDIQSPIGLNHLVKECFLHNCKYFQISVFFIGIVLESGTGPIDWGATGPVPDHEPCLWGMSRVPVVCETTTEKCRDTGSAPARICSNSYFTNKNLCWSFILFRSPSLILKRANLYLLSYVTLFKLV